MLKPLCKNQDIAGQDGLWGVFNNAPALASSKDGYMLAIAPEDILRLDDFTPAEETKFWDFMFTRAGAGTQDAAARGLDSADATIPAHCSVICALNDGTAAWQAVGTTHGHIIWLANPETIGDMQASLDRDRSFYSGHGEGYQPLGRIEVKLTPDNYGRDIRQARAALRRAFNASSGAVSEESLGFSIYTRTACAGDPRAAHVPMVIESWSQDHPSVASLSGFARAWNGLTSTPVSPNPRGLCYSVFRKNP